MFMAAKLIDLTGRQFGGLTVLGLSQKCRLPSGRLTRIWTCSCECGATKDVDGGSLRRGGVQSCGCWLKHTPLTGSRFGMLLVGNEVSTVRKNQGGWTHRYACHCDCGRDCVVAHDHLRFGNKTSCGCAAKFIYKTDLVGERCGRLLVLSVAEQSSKIQSKKYLCRCDCGREVIVRHARIRSGSKTSCGCYEQQRRRLPERRVGWIAANRRMAARLSARHVKEKYGRLTIIGIHWSEKRKANLMRCRCRCGSVKVIALRELRTGKVKSCGCLHRESSSKTGARLALRNSTGRGKWQWSFRGIRLRSSLEAMMCEILAARGESFEYEPRMFVLGPAMRYIPDFYVGAYNHWIEVKGYCNDHDREKVKAFAAAGHSIAMVFKEDLEANHPLTYGRYLRARIREFLSGEVAKDGWPRAECRPRQSANLQGAA